MLDGEQRWPGEVLSWYRTTEGWRAVVRFTAWSVQGWPMTYEQGLPASALEPPLTPGHETTPRTTGVRRGVVRWTLLPRTPGGEEVLPHVEPCLDAAVHGCLLTGT